MSIEKFNTPKRVLVDQDGVLADFEGTFLNTWREKYPNRLFIPLEERKGFYIEGQYPSEYTYDIQTIYHSPGFIQNLSPIPGAFDALREMADLGINVKIVTTPLPRYYNCVLEKYIWIEENMGFDWTKKLILTSDKTLIHGDLLIDDREDVKGDHNPSWEHIVFDAPQNRHVKGKRRLMNWSNWKDVLLK